VETLVCHRRIQLKKKLSTYNPPTSSRVAHAPCRVPAGPFLPLRGHFRGHPFIDPFHMRQSPPQHSRLRQPGFAGAPPVDVGAYAHYPAQYPAQYAPAPYGAAPYHMVDPYGPPAYGGGGGGGGSGGAPEDPGAFLQERARVLDLLPESDRLQYARDLAAKNRRCAGARGVAPFPPPRPQARAKPSSTPPPSPTFPRRAPPRAGTPASASTASASRARRRTRCGTKK
jgi:hypothetical protein